ncbi:HesB/IscA family protein [Nitrospirillum viridazoti]|uniref:Iron-sulfur cluster assembly accessory protein n=1 Tax=Nitrospirillum amazonense TaxID=28077 RepID=A0A560I7D5_9PROT|nr:iron-sulfur cluster assembly accessory protein [Nitrospirillum amazonense]TWB53044.1 iron-sulfur cluster assembly accessory protein [Nitrospirillum amazonense]
MTFTITPAAERFIRFMLRADGGPEAGFRLVLSPGGCSGLSADMSVRAAPEPGDAVVECYGLRLFLPTESRLLLTGVTIDFADGTAQSGLVFRDPKAATSCATAPTPIVRLQ